MIKQKTDSAERVKTSFLLDKEEYELFKKLCKKNHSDASKEIRKFISEYNNRHKASNKLGEVII